MPPTAYPLPNPSPPIGRPAGTSRPVTLCTSRQRACSCLPEPGCWPCPPAGSDYPHAPHYRLADGRVVAIPEPLTSELAVPLTDPQALTALAAYRPLEQALAEDWGLQFEPVDALCETRAKRIPYVQSNAATYACRPENR